MVANSADYLNLITLHVLYFCSPYKAPMKIKTFIKKVTSDLTKVKRRKSTTQMFIPEQVRREQLLH